MKAILLVPLLLLLACVPPDMAAYKSKPAQPFCVSKFLEQTVTTKVVPGFWECMTPAAQQAIGSAEEFAANSAEDPVITKYTYVYGSRYGYFVYEASTNYGKQVAVVTVDSKGLVYRFKLTRTAVK